MDAIAIYWFTEIFSAGFFMSLILAAVIAHLKVGAQKNMVNGPAGWAKKFKMVFGKKVILMDMA